MKLGIVRIAISVIGIILFSLVLLFELNDMLSFLMASLGLGLIIIGSGLKVLVNLFV